MGVGGETAFSVGGSVTISSAAWQSLTAYTCGWLCMYIYGKLLRGCLGAHGVKPLGTGVHMGLSNAR